ncbi:type IV secretory pathway TraG/TraD family ATPase VirD4 [Georgenia soli]|uniref:Type IV secretory pathway TraG/TraD family ATPase VirD4 n=1 Tax=Georgenia soli TaxID=638953 RepID=A0A2A9F159_9MICO|nr:TraM recognition domain-containing protein [Georgenia soli]PFG45044.1 type IV secretory pathway TraG/TraD family ATPase VirD4 [Georgenia soli]
MATRENRPPIKASTRANVQLALLAVALLAYWHLTLWVTSTGLGLTDVDRTLLALVRLSPLDLGEDVTTASLPVVLAIWFALVILTALALVGAVAARHRGRTEKGMVTGKALKERVTGGPSATLLEPIASYHGQPVRPRTEDTGCVIAPPRQGKTAYLAVGQVVDAPGAVVATSTKVDLFRLTAQPRAERGRVWVFDPEGVSAWPEAARWNIVAGCADVKVAMDRAKAMVAARPMDGSRNAGFFHEAADTVLRCLLHAADLGGHTMREVLAWARDFDNETPYAILREHEGAAPGWAKDLEKFARGEARETVSSTDMSLSLVLKPLADPRVVDFVCPAAGDGEAFDPDLFVRSSDTLYLLSEGGSSGVAPLITALVSAVVRAGRLASQRTAAGRLDPPITFVLDEVANIAPIPDLPQLMADGGGRGMSVWPVVQDESQLRSRYGEEGAKTIWAAAAVKLLMGGSSNDGFLESVSRLLGDRRVTRSARHYSERGETPSFNVSTEKERVLSVSDLRTIPEGRALLLYRDLPGGIVDLTPWWKRSDAEELKASTSWVLDGEGITA